MTEKIEYTITDPSGKEHTYVGPKGMSRPEVIAALQEQQATMQQQPASQSNKMQLPGAVRAAEFAARGVSDPILETVGGIPDLPLKALHAAGVPGVNPNYFEQSLKKAYHGLGSTLAAPINYMFDFGGAEPKSPTERVSYMAGRGAGTAALFAAPMAGAAQTLKAGTLPQYAAKTLAQHPGLQMAAGATAGAVEEMTGNPYLGMGAAMLTPAWITAGKNMAKRVVSPFQNNLRPYEKVLVQAAEDVYGIPLTPAQKTGSKALQVLEAVFQKLPMTADKQMQFVERAGDAYTVAALKTTGIKELKDITPSSMDEAFKLLGKRYQEWGDDVVVNVDWGFFDDIARAGQEYMRRLPTDLKAVVGSYVDDLAQMKTALTQSAGTGVSVGGAVRPDSAVQIPGRQFIDIVSDMKKTARANAGTPAEEAILTLVQHLDEMLERGAGTAARAAKKSIDRSYANLKIISDAASRGTQYSRSGGVLAPNSLTQAVKASTTKDRFVRGRGDLNELARIGDYLGSTIVPSSGTAERTYFQNMLTQGGVGGGTLMYLGLDPVSAGVVSLGLPSLAQKAYNSRPVSNYLSNQLARSEQVLDPTLAITSGLNRATVKTSEANENAKSIALQKQLDEFYRKNQRRK